MASPAVRYAGIGRGFRRPSGALIEAVSAGLQTVMRGVSNEAAMLVEQLNDRYARDEFALVRIGEVRQLAACCVSRCSVAEQETIAPAPSVEGFRSRLVACAVAASG
jgi:hypothetical protein